MREQFNPVVRRARRALHPLQVAFIDASEWCADHYLSNTTVRASVDALTALLGLLIIDRLLGFPIAFRLAYLAPLWLAAQRGGEKPGLILVVLTTVTLNVINLSCGLIGVRELPLNVALSAGVLYGLMRLIVRTESQLQTYASMATRDSLTGIGNRLAFEEFARQAVDRSLLAGEPLSLVMVDCDKFKILNDTYGHAYGDHILKTVARLLRRGAQPAGFAARTGGDEFIVVLPGKTAQEAGRVLAKVHAKFSESTDILGQPASFSFGVSELGEHGISVQALLDAADKDMYVRKGLRVTPLAVVHLDAAVELESA
jgi:diguanylate cyclase (GGDEF)-like protein